MVTDSYLEVAAQKLGYKNVFELKKTKHQALKIAVDKAKGFTSITKVCRCFNLKRDAFYKYNRRDEQRKSVEQQILHIVNKRRKSLHREGVRKLIKSLDDDFKKQKLKVGIDTLFKVLREHQMLTLRKRYCARTTNSYHRFYKYNKRFECKQT